MLTHLYLLLGCAIPVWLEGGLGGPCAASRSTQLRGAAGILLVGVGDACAAAVGVHFGRRSTRPGGCVECRVCALCF